MSLLLLFFLFSSGCAGTLSVQPSYSISQAPLPPSLYGTLPPNQSPRETPSFFLVDDFNSRGTKNLIGALWETEASQKGGFRFKHITRDSLQITRGGALRFKASLPAHATVSFKSSLKGLDMSKAEALVFNCQVRAEAGKHFLGKLELRLKDLKGKTQAHDFTSNCLAGATNPKGWREAVLPRSFFSSLDWNQLAELALLFSASAEPLKTEVKIDEIAFYGKGNVDFQSERDNLLGFPAKVKASERAAAILAEPSSEKFLTEIARDTWKYFEDILDKNTHLPPDHIRVGEVEGVGSYTSPTNMALYLLSCVSAYELGFISKKEALDRILKISQTLVRMKRWKGFHYNYYQTSSLLVTRDYISSVDSGWLAAAWIVLRQAFPEELGELASRFLKETDFDEFYDPGIGWVHLGYDESTGNFSPYHYGLLATEARLTSFLGVGKGDLPREHWWMIGRTAPERWTWQNQTPQGKMVDIEKVSFIEGYYVYQGKKYVPSWGGSIFEFLAPTLLMKEKELAPEGLGLNNLVTTEIQIDYALNRQGYPVWGLAPAATATSSGQHWQYREYGVKYLGVKGYKDEGVIAPYATFLALDPLPEQAIDNLRRMLKLYDIYGEYGFYDSVNVLTGRVNTQYLVLDQGMSLIALCNYLRKGAIKEYFHKDPIAKKAETLLSKERFFQ